MRKGGRNVRGLERNPDLLKAAEVAFNRSAAIVDRRMREINAARDKLAAEVDKALEPPSRDHLAAAMASEIRSHLKSKEVSERLRLFHKAADAGDRATIATILHAPAYLTGLDAEQHAELREFAAAAFAPQAAAEVAEIDSMLERVRQAGSTMSTHYGEIVSRLQRPGDDGRAKTIKALARGE